MYVLVDKASNQPLYEQLTQQFIDAIVTSELSPGTKLPSVRRLSKDLEISLHTVNKAYAKLRELGYVSMAERSAPKVVETPPKQTAAWLSTQVEAFVTEMRRAGFSADEVKKEAETLLNKGGSSWKD